MHARRFGTALLLCLVSMGVGVRGAVSPTGPWILEAEEAERHPGRIEVVEQDSFRGKRGVALRAEVTSAGDVAEEGPKRTGQVEPDLVFRVTVPGPGRYSFTTYAAVDARGAALMAKAKTKFESLFLRLQIEGQEATRRVVFVPWGDPKLCAQHTGNFDLAGPVGAVRVWLPAGVRLDRLEVRPFRAPAVPAAAVSYVPPVVPPARHPRLWVGPESLARARTALAHPDHKPHWDRLLAAAAKPFPFAPPPRGELPFNTPLEQAALHKAFCHLMREEAGLGREAVDLMLAYLPRVSFGNLLDITREMGAAIYAGSCVYDWCHGLMTTAERDVLRRALLRLADDMECGWPPFRNSVVNGHGNEAMINRDLLSMGIAIHDEDPVPYRYCAYRLLEELVPMRRFEYQSPRHNQGVNYGAYRFGWEMHAAWLLRRLAGREVFGGNLKTVPQYWLHMRLPNGEMLRDGDGTVGGRYWRHPATMLLCYTYGGDPVMKGEFLRQGGGREQPLLYLLLDDPALRAEASLEALPRTIDFGPVLGGMIARTGWTMGPESAEVVAEIKGGGHHFGNHQHAEAGALQIYYRGLQAGKLSQYGFYGTPYDLNFSKRSAAQSMLLVVDPKEKFLNGAANDGGSRFVQAHPRTPAEARDNATFRYGSVESCSFGPDPVRPDFSYFAADLREAYSAKVRSYVRRFCFLNLGRPGNPAAMIVADSLAVSDPAFEKIWQLNALNPPVETAHGVRLASASGGITGRLDVRLLEPAPGDRSLRILSGAAAHTVGGRVFTPPNPKGVEAGGHRIQFLPKAARGQEHFLVVLQACDAEPLPVAHTVSGDMDIVSIADRVVALARTGAPARSPFDLVVEPVEAAKGTTVTASAKRGMDGGTVRVLLAGLAPGVWRLAAPGLPPREFTVARGRNTFDFETHGGAHRIEPAAVP